MKEKFLPFVYGFVLTLGLILLSGWYYSRPTRVAPPDIPIVDENGLDQLKASISTLNNYGNLPQNADSNSVGKTNPFE